MLPCMLSGVLASDGWYLSSMWETNSPMIALGFDRVYHPFHQAASVPIVNVSSTNSAANTLNMRLMSGLGSGRTATRAPRWWESPGVLVALHECPDLALESSKVPPSTKRVDPFGGRLPSSMCHPIPIGNTVVASAGTRGPSLKAASPVLDGDLVLLGRSSSSE